MCHVDFPVSIKLFESFDFSTFSPIHIKGAVLVLSTKAMLDDRCRRRAVYARLSQLTIYFLSEFIVSSLV